MADTPMHLIHDLATGKTELRPYTAAELAQRDQDIADAAALKIEQDAIAEAKADAKLAAQAKLQALGLTGEEIAAITE